MAKDRKPVDFSLLAVERLPPTKSELTPTLSTWEREWLKLRDSTIGREWLKALRLHRLFGGDEWLRRRRRLLGWDEPVAPLRWPGRPPKLQVELILPKPASPPPRQEKTLKRKWRRDEVTAVVHEMFPGGSVPEGTATVELVRQLGNKLEQRGIRGVSVATMERALGRRH